MTHALIWTRSRLVHVKVGAQRTLCMPDRRLRGATSSATGDTSQVTCHRCRQELSSLAGVLSGVR